MKPLLLLTNDDGYFADGLRSLARHLKAVGEVVVVAPDREKSAVSLALTLRRPLRLEKIRPRVFAVDGTPADCVYLALAKILTRRPALLVSGINHGPNLGRQDISYSGTVSAATQGAFLGIPSMAVSLIPDDQRRFAFEPAAEFSARLAGAILKTGLPSGVLLNVNIPSGKPRGVELTELGEKRYNPEVVEKRDPRDRTYYWIGLAKPEPVGGRRSDVRAVERGCISVTPVQTDRTARRTLASAAIKRVFQEIG